MDDPHINTANANDVTVSVIDDLMVNLQRNIAGGMPTVPLLEVIGAALNQLTEDPNGHAATLTTLLANHDRDAVIAYTTDKGEHTPQSLKPALLDQMRSLAGTVGQTDLQTRAAAATSQQKPSCPCILPTGSNCNVGPSTPCKNRCGKPCSKARTGSPNQMRGGATVMSSRCFNMCTVSNS